MSIATNNEKNEEKDEIFDIKSENSSELSQIDKEENKINISSPKQKIISKKTKRKINIVVNLDTVAYDIIRPYESKNRNYEKISLEIKKIEIKNDLEKSKLQKQIMQLSKRISEKELIFMKKKYIDKGKEEEKYNKELHQSKVNLQTKKLTLFELEKDKKINYIDIIQKLNIPPEKRKIKDILRIKAYIEQSNLGKNLREEFSDINIVEKLIYFCCIEMCYEKYQKGEVLYKIGDSPNSFYSIIFGKVNILKPIEKHELLTGFQYFNYLMKLRKEKEKYIFNQCLKYNKINYAIEPNDGYIIHYIYLINYLDFIYNKNNLKLELDKILDLIDINPEELGIIPSKINSNVYINNNMKEIKKRIPKISEITINKYSFINNYIIKKEVLIYEYKKVSVLKSNDYFGNNEIETHSIRNETAIAEENTEVAYLPYKLYFSQIAILKSIELENKISVLHSKFFFNKIKYAKFSKKYYKYFIKEDYIKGDILFNENTKIKYIYFIQEGKAELYTSKSMNEIEQLIKLLIEKKYENKDKPKDNYKYSQLISDHDDFVNFINQKQSNKLLILNSNEDIGAVSYYLGDNYLSSCIIVSTYAKIFKIDIKYIKLMIIDEYDCHEEFEKRMKKKLTLLSERLFKINNIKLIKTDGIICEKKLNEKNNKEKTKTNNSHNKTLVNYEKINNIFSENNKDIIKRSFFSKTNDFHLPILNSNCNKKNISKFSYIENNELNKSYFNKKYINKKNELKYENNLIKRINKEIEYFTKKKNSLTKKRRILTNNSNSSIKDSKDNEGIHINNISNNGSFTVRNEEKELFNNSNINTVSTSTQINEKLGKSMIIPKIVKFRIIHDNRSLSNDYKRIRYVNAYEEKEKFNTIKKNNENKYAHPYYESKALIKKEKYKVFERNDKDVEFQNEFFKTQIKRIRDLKNLHLSMIKNPHHLKFNINTNNHIK